MMAEIERIHWLASYPKSGNTWVRALLYAYKFGNVGLQQMKGFIPSDQLPGAWFAASPVPWGILTEDQRLLIRYPALMVISTTCSNTPCILKTHCGNIRVNSVDLIPGELTGRSIYLVRDPRDVVISYAHHMGMSIDDGIDRMSNIGCTLNNEDTGIVQPTGSWSVNVMSWYEYGHFERSIIRYEDLIKNTAHELAHIIECLMGEKADPERVAKAVELCEFNCLKKMEQTSGFQEASQHGEFFRVGRSTWRDVLTEKQVKRIEDDHGEWMQKMGYELSFQMKGVA